MASGKDLEQGGLVDAEVAIRLQRQLDAAQKITHTGSWELDLATSVVM